MSQMSLSSVNFKQASRIKKIILSLYFLSFEIIYMQDLFYFISLENVRQTSLQN